MRVLWRIFARAYGFRIAPHNNRSDATSCLLGSLVNLTCIYVREFAIWLTENLSNGLISGSEVTRLGYAYVQNFVWAFRQT